MKHIYLPLISFLCTLFVTGQEKVLISETITGHIYKPEMVAATSEKISKLKLPKDFAIDKYASDLGRPRIMAVDTNGRVYVSRREGDILLLMDTDGDGKADSRRTVMKKEGVHGLTLKGNSIYFATVNEVYRASLSEDGSIASPEKILENLPDGGQHANRTLAFGPDQKLYISIGSTCNACKETRDESATLIQAGADGTGRTIFASGLRNTIGFDWHPETGELYGLDHGIDWLGDDEQKEELNRITAGSDYGWPYIYADGKYNKADEPEGKTWKEYAETTTAPEMLFTAHSAPMSLKFYGGDMFPDTYRNAALATFRGSWNRKPPSGHKIMLIRFENGKPVASEDFVTGFLSADGTTRFARLVDLAELPDGSVLVSDDTNGIIYRISYGQ